MFVARNLIIPQKTKDGFYNLDFGVLTVQYVCMYCRRYTDYFVPYFYSCQQNMVQTILFIMDENTIESRVISLRRSIFVRITAVLGDIFTEVLT